MVKIVIHEELKKFDVTLGVVVIENIIVRPSSRSLVNEINNIIGEIKSKLGRLDALKEDPRIRAFRSFLWRLGIDPTKTRPSSEALARRILRGAEFPFINNIVDSGNASSLYYLVPIGLYDTSKIEGPLHLQLCKDECIFEPIGGKTRKLPPGTPVLIDSGGYVLHVFPHRDALKTSISEDTVSVLAVSAGVRGVEKDILIKSLEMIKKLLIIDGQNPVFHNLSLIT